MDFLKWLSEVGTDPWVSGFVKNNSYIVLPLILFAGAYLKGKYPEFWSKLSTAIPFIGDPRRKI